MGPEKKRLCVTNLRLYKRVSSVFDKREGWVDLVFLDSQKTFDTVPHKSLVKKLNLYAGITVSLFR